MRLDNFNIVSFFDEERNFTLKLNHSFSVTVEFCASDVKSQLHLRLKEKALQFNG